MTTLGSRRLVPSLRKFIADNPELRTLPPVRVLARDFGVPEWRMRQAVRDLRDESGVTFRRGSSIVIAGRSPATPTRVTAQEKLYRGIVDQIADGTLRAGTALPKSEATARSEHYSRTTISQVNRRLIDEGLAHRSGTRIIVGKPVAPARGTLGTSPVILVVVSRRGGWQSSYSSRTHPFLATFCELAERQGIRILLAVHRAHPGEPSLFVEGREEARAEARRLRPRYLGTLVMLPRSMGEDVNEWVEALIPLRRPVVWLDRNGDNLEEPITHPSYTRCSFTEQRGLGACLEFLRDHGHRRVLCPYTSESDWQSERFRLLDSLARSTYPELTIVPAPSLTPDFWTRPGSGRTVGLLNRICRERLGAVVRALDTVVETALPSRQAVKRSSRPPGTAACERFVDFSRRVFLEGMQLPSAALRHAETVWDALQHAEALLDRSITSILAPNDARAALIVGFLTAVGYQVPSRISLMGFDNSFLFTNLPVTSVDWGFGGLGYAAFHAITKDIPVRRARDGSIDAVPRVIDRGTVGIVRG